MIKEKIIEHLNKGNYAKILKDNGSIKKGTKWYGGKKEASNAEYYYEFIGNSIREIRGGEENDK